MNLKAKHEELRAHLSRRIDRARWPDYSISDSDLLAFIEHESTGQGSKPAPLAWCKRVEEITIHQLWSEMAEMWASGFGWDAAISHTISCEFRERKGSNIWLRKLIAIKRSIARDGFMERMLRFSGFTEEDRQKYLTMKFGPISPKKP